MSTWEDFMALSGHGMKTEVLAYVLGTLVWRWRGPSSACLDILQQVKCLRVQLSAPHTPRPSLMEAGNGHTRIVIH